MMINFRRRSNLLNFALVHNGDTMCHRHRLNLRLATGEIFYLQDSNQSIALEAVHGFDFDWSNVCLFDAESGENLEKRN